VSRGDGRKPDQLRPVVADPAFLEQPHGVVLWSQGKTRVLCTATVQDGVPRWLYRSGRGWMTAEYSLLPASTGDRTDREAARGKQGGRTVEIQRLIGRALRGVVDFQALGERTVYLDCDVLQADGGTRCAAICGGYVAMHSALARLVKRGAIPRIPMRDTVGAVSVGIIDGEPLLDLNYSEDSRAEVDMNVVMTGGGELIEVQATAERTPFNRASLDRLLELAAGGIEAIGREQAQALSGP
jgi:ribonuclease PH